MYKSNYSWIPENRWICTEYMRACETWKPLGNQMLYLPKRKLWSFEAFWFFISFADTCFHFFNRWNSVCQCYWNCQLFHAFINSVDTVSMMIRIWFVDDMEETRIITMKCPANEKKCKEMHTCFCRVWLLWVVCVQTRLDQTHAIHSLNVLLILPEHAFIRIFPIDENGIHFYFNL